MLPLPIITALVGALTGAALGGIISDVVTRRRERRSRRIRLVGELAAFSGRCEAALIRFQRIRIADKGLEFSEATHLGLAELTLCESDGQRLYWDIREAFRTESVSDAVWELTRRLSVVKEMLMFTEEPSAEFAEGLCWLNVQCRIVITLCAIRVGMPVHKDRLPFLLGLGGLDNVHDEGKYRSPEIPWAAIQEKRANERAQQMWEQRNIVKP
jgi:hypothetical protein